MCAVGAALVGVSIDPMRNLSMPGASSRAGIQMNHNASPEEVPAVIE
jgi:hypothetical protein